MFYYFEPLKLEDLILSLKTQIESLPEDATTQSKILLKKLQFYSYLLAYKNKRADNKVVNLIRDYEARLKLLYSNPTSPSYYFLELISEMQLSAIKNDAFAQIPVLENIMALSRAKITIYENEISLIKNQLSILLGITSYNVDSVYTDYYASSATPGNIDYSNLDIYLQKGKFYINFINPKIECDDKELLHRLLNVLDSDLVISIIDKMFIEEKLRRVSIWSNGQKLL